MNTSNEIGGNTMVMNMIKEADIFTRKELEVLLGQKSESCVSVSIFMPIQMIGRETRQNATRLKNLLRDAEKRLMDTGIRRPEAIKLLAPALALLDNEIFWRHQSDGLVLFISKDLFRSYRLPLNFKEHVVIGDRFHLKPLLPFFSGDGRFYILALSQNEVRLLQCTHYGVKEIDLTGIVPDSLEEVLMRNGTKRLESYHSSTAGSGKENVIFHGQDIGDTEKTNILRFFQRIDRGLHNEIFKEEKAPLILAAVDYLQSIYGKANTYKNLLDGSIAGNPDRVSSKDLQEKAWSIIRPRFDNAKIDAINEFKRLAGTGHTSTDMQEIVSNAYSGKIDTLFCVLDKELWGTFDPAASKVNLDRSARSCYVDLLDYAVAHALLHEGKVYALKSEEMPDNTSIAAIFRGIA
jgi:Bacterial archaeo-eukaryotic release factor family 7